MKVQHTLFAAAGLLLLAGCTTPPAVVNVDPYILEHEKTLDRVHNRDASAEFYTDNRGGAAVRQEATLHVLYNEHYEADPVAWEQKRQAELKAAMEKAQAQKAEADRKAKDDALRQVKLKADAAAKARDKSIYKDKSIYNKDKSIYATTSAKKVEPTTP
ncbi:MAG: hypothetical protein Q4E62_03970 [Sutterellaceae bacterium]|nr:hypothetical protein [Sutterellaceae bacterium]